MKAKFFWVILLTTMLVSLLGSALQTTPVIAAGVGQQFWYITDTLTLAASPSAGTGSSVISSPPTQAIGTSVTATADLTIPAGHWTGYIALSSPYTGSAVVGVAYGAGETVSGVGSFELPYGTYQNGFSFDFAAVSMSVLAGDKIYLRFQTGTPTISTGGTHSYVCPPPGSQAFPNPALTTTFGLTMSASGNGSTTPAASAIAYDYFDGTVVPVSATAQAGNLFTAWSGSITGTTNPSTVTMDGNKSVTASFAVNEKIPTTAVVTSSNSISISGQSVTFTATVTPESGLGVPIGSVVFKDGSTTLGNGTSIGSGQWTFSTSALVVGEHDIAAEYGGDSDFAASTSDVFVQRVVTGLVSLVLTSTASPIVVDDIFDVAIEAHCGSQAVVGLAAYLNFDSTKLAVVDMDVAATGIQITGGTTLDDPFQNSVDNISGRINFSAGVLSGIYPSGTFTVATIRFHALAVTSTDTALSFSATNPRETYVSGDNQGTEVTGTTNSATYAITSESDIFVSVGLQGANRPDSAWAIPLTVEFFSLGADIWTAEPVYRFTSTATKTSNKAAILCPSILAGNYDVTAVSPHTLLNIKKNVSITASTTELSLGTLLEGNANNDDRIDIDDFSLFVGSYGSIEGDSEYGANTDFDGCGSVDIADFSLLSGNYSKISPIEIPNP
jgi:hypothetical protein